MNQEDKNLKEKRGCFGRLFNLIEGIFKITFGLIEFGKVILFFVVLYFLLKLSGVGKDDIDNQNENQNQEEFIGEQPMIQLQKFAIKMEDYDWSTDTSLCREHQSSYNSFRQYEIKYFKGKPFLKIEYQHTMISDHKGEDELITDGFQFEIFENAKNIWAFYYINTDRSNLMRGNGIIENWEFENNNQAKLAMKNLKNNGLMSYYSDPFFYVEDNHLIIFHTMGNLLTSTQKKLFLKFKNYMK